MGIFHTRLGFSTARIVRESLPCRSEGWWLWVLLWWVLLPVGLIFICNSISKPVPGVICNHPAALRALGSVTTPTVLPAPARWQLRRAPGPVSWGLSPPAAQL